MFGVPLIWCIVAIALVEVVFVAGVTSWWAGKRRRVSLAAILVGVLVLALPWAVFRLVAFDIPVAWFTSAGELGEVARLAEIDREEAEDLAQKASTREFLLMVGTDIADDKTCEGILDKCSVWEAKPWPGDRSHWYVKVVADGLTVHERDVLTAWWQRWARAVEAAARQQVQNERAERDSTKAISPLRRTCRSQHYDRRGRECQGESFAADGQDSSPTPKALNSTARGREAHPGSPGTTASGTLKGFDTAACTVVAFLRVSATP
jgi:hypothetical protein